MTQEQFYDNIDWHGTNRQLRPDQQTRHQRLIKDLRDNGFTWDQIWLVYQAMDGSPYRQEWA